MFSNELPFVFPRTVPFLWGESAVMRVYGDPVVVLPAPDGQPAKFVWRDRLYVVRRVMQHWVSTRDWRGDDYADGVVREFWQVEAALGGQLGVHELRYEPETDTWLLARPWGSYGMG